MDAAIWWGLIVLICFIFGAEVYYILYRLLRDQKPDKSKALRADYIFKEGEADKISYLRMVGWTVVFMMHDKRGPGIYAYHCSRNQHPRDRIPLEDAYKQEVEPLRQEV